jgi:hypothetical protein
MGFWRAVYLLPVEYVFGDADASSTVRFEDDTRHSCLRDVPDPILSISCSHWVGKMRGLRQSVPSLSVNF